MKHKLVILLLITCGCFSSIASGQSAKSESTPPVSLSDLLELFTPKNVANENFVADANQNAMIRLSWRCDVGFVDDGTNYWALRLAGASEALIREIARCTLASTIEKHAAARKALTEQQICHSQKSVAGDLVRLLYRGKDIAGRKRVLIAMNEYIKRYGEGDRCVDRGTDEFLMWLKFQIPRIQKLISDMQGVS